MIILFNKNDVSYSNSTDVESAIFSIDERRPPLQAFAFKTTSRFRHSTPRIVSTRRIIRTTTPRPRQTTRRLTTRTTTRRSTTRTTTRRRTTRTTTRRATTRTTTRRATTRTTTRRITPRTTTPRPTTTTTRRRNRPQTTTPRTTTSTTRRKITTKPKPITTTYRTKIWTWPATRTTPIRLPPTSTRSTIKKTTTTPKPPSTTHKEPIIQTTRRRVLFADHSSIEKKYNFTYNGHFPIPQPHPAYHGYYVTKTTYRYQESDTGNSLLGFYMGHKLGQLTTPTYAHQSFYTSFAPQYDHYTVHHYYHNAETELRRHDIPSSNIIGCVGDTRDVCPSGTISLCTNDGQLMCVATVASLVACIDADNQTVTCARSRIPCDKNSAKECVTIRESSVEVDVPCLGYARIDGKIKYINNTVQRESSSTVDANNGTLAANGTIIAGNGTSISLNGTSVTLNVTANGTVVGNNTTTVMNATVVFTNGTEILKDVRVINETVGGNVSVNGTTVRNNQTSSVAMNETTIISSNGTTTETAILLDDLANVSSADNVSSSRDNTSMSVGSTIDFSTPYPITTVPSPTSVHWIWRRKRTVPVTSFCVIVVARPAKRKLTEGEEFLNDAKNMFQVFIEQSWKL